MAWPNQRHHTARPALCRHHLSTAPTGPRPHRPHRGARRCPPGSGASAPARSRAPARIAVVIFIIQNPHAINVSFLGVHVLLPQSMALLLAVLAGVLLTAGAGSARIAQLRRIMRRDQRKPPAG